MPIDPMSTFHRRAVLLSPQFVISQLAVGGEAIFNVIDVEI